MTTWQDKLIRRYPNVFLRSFRSVPFAPGYPRCEDGWQDLVTRLVERVDAAHNDGTVYLTHMVAEHGGLRVHWNSRTELTQRTAIDIEEAVALAEARSLSTCVVCGAEGRLFASGFRISPLCKDHESGTPVPVVSGFHDVFAKRGIVRSRSVLMSVRYDWAADAFVQAQPREVSKKDSRHG
jgi:hypothetical protein